MRISDWSSDVCSSDLAGERRQRAVVALSIASCLALVVLATMLLLAAAQPGGDGALAAVYRIGDWPARFGIVLVVDRLSALMLLLASVLALAVLPAALARWQRSEEHTSELQSIMRISYAVFCLKKNTKQHST